MRRTPSSRKPVLIFRALAGLSLSLLTGCLNFPEADERFNDQIVITRFDEAADFEAYKTFAIRDVVTVFEEDDGEIATDPLDEPKAKQLIERTISNLEARGYVMVAKDEDPDLGVTVSIIHGRVTGYYSSYWGSYWGYPYWGYYYPYYYTYSYDTGAMVTDMVDLKNAPPPAPAPAEGDQDPTHRLDVLWTGIVYGVLDDSSSVNVQNGVEGIDQTFRQSLYIRAAE